MSLHHKPPVLTYRYSHHKSLFTHSRFVTHLGKVRIPLLPRLASRLTVR
nr:uncharacterized protein CTRU02_15345 [Colletotrichum truncatum]KAF6781128.1 hypothetical protein CTRU02_15345 [Colletotrichum truncatum]